MISKTRRSQLWLACIFIIVKSFHVHASYSVRFHTFILMTLLIYLRLQQYRYLFLVYWYEMFHNVFWLVNIAVNIDPTSWIQRRSSCFCLSNHTCTRRKLRCQNVYFVIIDCRLWNIDRLLLKHKMFRICVYFV